MERQCESEVAAVSVGAVISLCIIGGGLIGRVGSRDAGSADAGLGIIVIPVDFVVSPKKSAQSTRSKHTALFSFESKTGFNDLC